MLELLDSGKKILNIDESWISDTNHLKFKWLQQGTTNSLQERSVNPRISVLGAVSTEGNVYISITQVITDSEIIKLFL